jgi:NADH-quinone oxidoreductase subunit J
MFFFILFSVTSVVAALLVITRRAPLYSALFLAVTLCAQAGLFTLLGAVFVGVIQILIYAGAILILFLFVIMSLERTESQWVLRNPVVRAISGITVGVLVVQMLYSLWRSNSAAEPLILTGGPRGEDHIAILGKELFTRYLVPFEIGSILLLVAVLGAVVLAYKRGK